MISSATSYRPETGEAPFGLDEVFFSRTDGRGTIQAANSVFWRVADFKWADMKGAPHNIVRHPDMPKSVFWLLWDTIKQGEIIGAYVKNRARDGLYYWVFAVVVPLDDGFLSVRIKPSSPTLKIIEEEYAALLKLEQEQDLSPADGAKHLLERIKKLGHSDYHHFSCFALTEELNHRNATLKRADDSNIATSRKMLGAAQELKKATAELVRNFEMTNVIPHNMRLLASRLEPSGGPLSTLSTNYGSMAREMSDWFEDHVVGPKSNFSTIEASVNQGMCLESLARLLSDCALQLNGERDDLSSVDFELESGLLKELVEQYNGLSAEGHRELKEEATRIKEACRKMYRFMLGLTTTQSMCRTEGARIQSDVESLNDVITQLSITQKRMDEILIQIDRQATLIHKLAA